MKIRNIIAAAFLIMVMFACGEKDSGQNEPITYESGTLTVTFDFEKQSGYASNQFAVWIEDADGNLIKTLCATKYTANGGYKNRPDSISEWVEKSGLSSMTKSEVDVIAESTPKSGTAAYVWDLTDNSGEAVESGEYKFLVEGSLRWKNRVLYSGLINIGESESTVEAAAEYFYEESEDQAALNEESPENSMIKSVTAVYKPTQ